MTNGVLGEVARALELSGEKPFRNGDFDDWSKWACRMRDTMAATVPVIRATCAGIATLEQRIVALEAALAAKDDTILALALGLSPGPRHHPSPDPQAQT